MGGLQAPRGQKALAKDLAAQHPNIDWASLDLKGLNEAKWEALVASGLKHLKQDNYSITY